MVDDEAPLDGPGANPAGAVPAPSFVRDAAEVLACSGYPTQILLSALLRAAGVAPFTPEGHLSAAFVFMVSLLDTAALLVLMLAFMRARGESARAIYLGGRPVLAEAAWGVTTLPLVLIAVALVSAAIRLLAPALHNVPENPLEAILGTQAGLPLFLFVVVVAGGIREELQRAFLLTRLGPLFGDDRLALVLTSLAFGLGHTLQGLDAAIITALLGALWGAAYLTRRSAIGAMVSHSLFNSGQLLVVAFR